MRRILQFGLLTIGILALSAPAWADADASRITLASWTWPSYIAIPLFLSLFLYVAGTLKLWRRTAREHPPASQVAWFLAGWVALLIALDSPVHELSEQLFWVHMTQHEILMVIAAPLLVMGRPLDPMLWALPRSWRFAAGAVSKNRIFESAWLAISAPFAAWLLHGLALWLWHAPILFDATLRSDAVHAFQHISFLATALLFWWALVHRHKGRLGYGGAVLYVFTTALHMSLLSALLTFSPTPWYAPYVQTAAAWNLSPLQDQQLGGLIMWIPAGTVLLVIGLVFFWKWMQDSDRRWEYTRTASLLRVSGRVAK